MEPGVEREFRTSDGKIHIIEVLRLGNTSKNGTRRIRYKLDHEVFVEEIQVEKRAAEKRGIEMADESDPYQIGAPFDADLWLVHKKAGDNVKAGEEIFNLALMKVEYGITSPVDGVVKRVPVFADYKADKKMVPVTKGQLLMELALPHKRCANCSEPVDEKDKYCSNCGKSLDES